MAAALSSAGQDTRNANAWRQIFSARPMLGYADYRGPIAGLYLCGSGGHPGGGVTGAPGHNAAREILRDFKRKRIARIR